MDSTSEGEGETMEEVVDLTQMEDLPSAPPSQGPVSTEPSDTQNKTPVKPKINKTHLCRAPPKSRCVEAYKCPICRDSIRKGIPVATTCGHVFCKGCLVKALQLARKCPLCREFLPLNGFQRIFL